MKNPLAGTEHAAMTEPAQYVEPQPPEAHRVATVYLSQHRKNDTPVTIMAQGSEITLSIPAGKSAAGMVNALQCATLDITDAGELVAALAEAMTHVHDYEAGDA